MASQTMSPVVFHHIRLYGKAVLRRLLDGRHVPDTGKRHIQRAGYRRCRKRQHVHPAAEFLYMFFMIHPEALLLVNYQEPQIFERHVLLKQPVSAYDQVHGPALKVAEDLVRLGGRFKP